jgi:hypothetical protein
VIWLKKTYQLGVLRKDTYSFVGTEESHNYQERHLIPSYDHVMLYEREILDPWCLITAIVGL